LIPGSGSEIIASLSVLKSFDLPILVGPSRKHFLKRDQQDLTEFATAGAVAASILSGAHMVRVHDVKAMKSVVDIVDSIKKFARDDDEAQAGVAQARWQRGQ
jgi:dihydropteroate synthase